MAASLTDARCAISVSCQWLPLSSDSSGQTASATLAESSGSYPCTTACPNSA